MEIKGNKVYGDGYQKIKEMKVAKIMCEDSLLFFICYFFEKQYGKPFQVNWHHVVLCRALEKVAKGDILKLIINMPPRHGKTEVCVKGFIAWGLSLNQTAKFLHLSYSADLAMDNSNTIKELLQSDAYRELFNVELKKSKKSKKNWSTELNGGVYAAATGGQVTGFGAGSMDQDLFDVNLDMVDNYLLDIKRMQRFAGCIIIDDPMKPEDADSNIQRDKINMRFQSTIKSRVNSAKTPIVIDMQRLHPEDMCGVLIEEGGWEVLSFPVIIDQNTIDTAAKYGVILSPEKLGRPLWEDSEEALENGTGNRKTLEQWMEHKRLNPLVFETQYMQNPRPLEGLIFPKEDLQYFSGKCPEGVPIFYGDPADEGIDRYAMPLGVIANGFVYIDDVIFSLDNLTELEPRIVAEINKRKPPYVFIESNNAGALHIRDIKRQIKGSRVQGVPHHTNKYARMLAEEGIVKTYFKFRSDYKQGSEYEAFMKQIWWILKNGKEKRDDAPDAISGLSYACRIFYNGLLKIDKL